LTLPAADPILNPETHETMIIDDIEETTKVMREYYEFLERGHRKIEASNARLLKVLTKIKGKNWVKGLRMALDELEGIDSVIRVTRRKPKKCDWQAEDYGPIKGMWVEQWARGMDGDSWEGTIWIQVDAKRYLEMHYSC
jgi:hypothetical protein